MIKIGSFLATLLLASSVAYATLKPNEPTAAMMVCMSPDFITELAELHVKNGVGAAQQEVAANRDRFNSECMTSPEPFMVIPLEVIKDVTGPKGHVKIWKVTDPTQSQIGYAVEILPDAGA